MGLCLNREGRTCLYQRLVYIVIGSYIYIREIYREDLSIFIAKDLLIVIVSESIIYVWELRHALLLHQVPHFEDHWPLWIVKSLSTLFSKPIVQVAR